MEKKRISAISTDLGDDAVVEPVVINFEQTLYLQIGKSSFPLKGDS
jgi:hypothetical protein